MYTRPCRNMWRKSSGVDVLTWVGKAITLPRACRW